jgi:hypothetical protein
MCAALQVFAAANWHSHEEYCMKTLRAFGPMILIVFAVLMVSSASPQTQTASAPAAPSPDQAEMMKQMIELSKPGENHRLLASIAGTWSFTGRHLQPYSNAKPKDFKGRFVRKAIWEGRYFISETTGEKLQMPWSDGKEVTVKDMAIEGYDNNKKKFLSSYIDNHWDTGVIAWEGSYDSAAKTFTYVTEMEESPGTKIKMERLVRILDENNYREEIYEEHSGKEQKVTEINYTRVRGE